MIDWFLNLFYSYHHFGDNGGSPFLALAIVIGLGFLFFLFLVFEAPSIAEAKSYLKALVKWTAAALAIAALLPLVMPLAVVASLVWLYWPEKKKKPSRQSLEDKIAQLERELEMEQSA